MPQTNNIFNWCNKVPIQKLYDTTSICRGGNIDHSSKTGPGSRAKAKAKQQFKAFLAVNAKSYQEFDVVQRAREQGCLRNFKSVRRPYNLTESNADFIAERYDGSYVQVDIKGLSGLGKRPIKRQTQDIIKNIKKDFLNADNSSDFRTVCDLASVPTFMQKKIYKQITDELTPNQITQTDFLFT